MSLGARIANLERERPPGECACGTVHIMHLDSPDAPTGPVPPCAQCGLEPLVIQIVTVRTPLLPQEPGP